MSSAPSPAQVQRALSQGAELLKADRLKPSVADYISEGVLKHAPEPDSNGRIDTKVEGHDNVVRMLQMNEAHYFAKGRIGAARQSDIRRIPMRDRHGRIRMVAEEREDNSALKHGARRLVTVSGHRLPDFSEGHEMLRDGRWQRYVAGEWVET